MSAAQRFRAISITRRLVGQAYEMMGRFRLSNTARSVVRQRLTYLPARSLCRLEHALSDVVMQRVSGDVVEFGVALGGTTIILAEKAKQSGRNFHGFDVFGMIPPPSSEKDGEKANQRYQTIAKGASAGINGDLYYGYRPNLYAEVCDSLARYGLDVDGHVITLHKGLFQETFHKAAISSIAFAHLDCDWYESVSYCLSATADLVSPNGVIVLDDYHFYEGCKRATTEFLASRPDFTFHDGENVILRKTQK